MSEREIDSTQPESGIVKEVGGIDSMPKAIEQAIRDVTGLFGSVSVGVSHDAVNDHYKIGVWGTLQEKEPEWHVNKDASAPTLPKQSEDFSISGVAVEAIYAYRSLLAASETYPGLKKLVRLVGAVGICGEDSCAYLSDYIKVAPEDFLAVRTDEDTRAVGGNYE
jgi:hypothetical protein